MNNLTTEIMEQFNSLSLIHQQEAILFVELVTDKRSLPPRKHAQFFEYLENNDFIHVHELLKEEITASA